MQKFVARQAILDREQQILGYEILFRSGPERSFRGEDPDAASASVVVSSSLLIGVDELTDGRSAFINFTRSLLVGDFASVLPPERLVVEVLETVEPDAEVVAACQRLKDRGYRIALDDFVPDARWEPLVALADIIKVDIRALPREAWTALPGRYRRRGLYMLAEKVETREEFRSAAHAGYGYFQGYFFSKPQTLARRDIPPDRLSYLRLLDLASREQPDVDEIEQVIKSESSLCYRLLRYINSAAFAFARTITSIRHAVALLGLRELRKLVALVSLAGLSDGKPALAEVLAASVIRARFAELLAPCLGLEKQAGDLFILGLISMMDVVLECPLEEIVAELAVSDDVRGTLLGRESPLRPVYDLVLAYERADWRSVTRLSEPCGMTEATVAGAYMQAVRWNQRTFQGGPAEPAAARA